MLYILAIALQISGAIILSCSTLSTKRETVVKKFIIDKDIVYADGNTKELTYNEDAFVSIFVERYSAILSVFYIIFGYLLGTVEKPENQCTLKVVSLILLFVALLVFITKIIIKFCIKNSKRINNRITYDELNKLGLTSTVESISVKEIDVMFED